MLKIFCASVSLWLIFLSACSELEKPKTEPFYAQTAPPQKKEFRWSNGKMPKSFDPARAAAPPETDIVRACFEGLTDTNAKNLAAIPAVAEKWTASADFKTWTFYLRKDVKWSNGELLTSDDFVSSWKRLVEMGENVSHRQLKLLSINIIIISYESYNLIILNCQNNQIYNISVWKKNFFVLYANSDDKLVFR